MSYIYSGSASNITTNTLMTLTGTGSTSTGSITLSNALSQAGCLARFTLSNGAQGSTTFTFGDANNQFSVNLTGASNSTGIFYNGGQVASGGCTYTNSNSIIAVRYSPSSSNTVIKLYVNSTSPTLSYNVSYPYVFSPISSYFKWTGSNTSATPIQLGIPLIENVEMIDNSLSVQDSLFVKRNATIGGNLNVSGTTNAGVTVITSGGATLGGAQVGDFGLGSSYFAGFNHSSQPYNTSGYAFLADYVGNCYINTGSSNHIVSFRQSNNEVMRVDTTGTLLTTALSNQSAMTTSNITTRAIATSNLTCSGTITSTSITASNVNMSNLIVPSLQLGSSAPPLTNSLFTYGSFNPSFALVSGYGSFTTGRHCYSKVGNVVTIVGTTTLLISGNYSAPTQWHMYQLPFYVDTSSLFAPTTGVCAGSAILDTTIVGTVTPVDYNNINFWWNTGGVNGNQHVAIYTFSYISA